MNNNNSNNVSNSNKGKNAHGGSEGISMKVIARIRNDFPSKFGIPRQSGVVRELTGRIVFEPEYRNPDALRGIDGFDYLWLIWQFSEAVRDK
ncbi:MAG: SAM-dependent methyltransferase, partial [Selenomonadaceae bacterium]|nr:SAM-dependent methyltransferase [Selenomonadaceae bacterium]